MKTIVRHSKGYILEAKPGHTHANQSGYVPSHRLIMEAAIGRVINPSIEDVHHIDGNVENNDLSNLRLLSKREHRREHNGWKLIDGDWWKTCSSCGRFLNVEANFYHRHSSHNEFISQCKKCLTKIGHFSSWRFRVAKEQIIVCVVCGKTFRASRYSHARHCSILCSWVTRKGGK